MGYICSFLFPFCLHCFLPEVRQSRGNFIAKSCVLLLLFMMLVPFLPWSSDAYPQAGETDVACATVFLNIHGLDPLAIQAAALRLQGVLSTT